MTFHVRCLPDGHIGFFKAEQLGLFGKPREEVKAPGSRGGRYYLNDQGHVVYGEKPLDNAQAVAYNAGQEEKPMHTLPRAKIEEIDQSWGFDEPRVPFVTAVGYEGREIIPAATMTSIETDDQIHIADDGYGHAVDATVATVRRSGDTLIMRANPKMYTDAKVAVRIGTGAGETVPGIVLTDVRRTMLPMPPVADGKITLPNLSGHAHARPWRSGDIVEIHSQYYRVSGKPKLSSGAGWEITYALTPASEKQMATRPGRVRLNVPTDKISDQVGRAVEVGDEWLAIETTSRQSYGSAEGEHFGYTYYGAGHFVSAAKAKKLNVAWQKKDRVRALELSLRVARSDDMSTPERVRRLEAELTDAKHDAGIVS